jgi:hypothetical protein
LFTHHKENPQVDVATVEISGIELKIEGDGEALGKGTHVEVLVHHLDATGPAGGGGLEGASGKCAVSLQRAMIGMGSRILSVSLQGPVVFRQLSAFPLVSNRTEPVRIREGARNAQGLPDLSITGDGHGASGRVVGEKEGAREKKNKQYQWNDRLEQGLAREMEKRFHE